MPANVIAALLKDLTPQIEAHSAFDRSMILLNEIVEILATSHSDKLPLRILPPQNPKGYVALIKPIERGAISDVIWSADCVLAPCRGKLRQ
jgi:hypothetical protein